MIRNLKWYHFYLSGHNLRSRWSIGWTSDAVHFNTPLIGMGLMYGYLDRKFWIGLLPKIPLTQGYSLYKYSVEIVINITFTKY